MRGRHERGARPRRRGDAHIDAQAFGVDRDRLQHRIRQHELASRQEIAGILHPHPVAWRQRREAGIVRAEAFSWSRYTSSVYELYRAVAGRPAGQSSRETVTL